MDFHQKHNISSVYILFAWILQLQKYTKYGIPKLKYLWAWAPLVKRSHNVYVDVFKSAHNKDQN